MSNIENGHGDKTSDFDASSNSGRPINRALTPGGHPLDQSQPAFPVYHRKLANPAPLGLFGFATTTLLLSLINVDTRDLSATPNIVICMAFAYGGLAQLLAGMWEGAAGNTFGFTAFSSYGAFWISYGIANVPWFNSASAYEDEGLLHDALGLYLMMWMIVTFLFLLACSRSSFSLISVFFFLTITFLLLGVGDLTGSTGAARAGGAFGIVTAFCAYYTAMTGLLSPTSSFFVLPAGDISKKD